MTLQENNILKELGPLTEYTSKDLEFLINKSISNHHNPFYAKVYSDIQGKDGRED